MPAEGPRHRERFEEMLARPLAVRKIVMTQSHPDHMGGWKAFAGQDSDIIVQRDFPWLWRERRELAPFFGPRGRRVLPTLISPEQHRLWHNAPEKIPDPTLFGDRLEFTVGDRRFELHATPSGETLDALIVWLPDERTIFTGNFMGALQGALPNFYTARGDRDRSMVRFLQDIELLIGLSPTLLITGHGEPIHGEEAIRAFLTKLRDAVKHIRDETVAGMNAQKSLHRLMREFSLPPHLEHLPGRGRMS